MKHMIFLATTLCFVGIASHLQAESADKLLKKAEAGDEKSIYTLVYDYLIARSANQTPKLKNDQEFIRWVRRLAEFGGSTFPLKLAEYYGEGKWGLQVDHVEACKWAHIVVSNPSFSHETHEKAKALQAKAEAKISPEQVAQAGKKARAWLAAHAVKIPSTGTAAFSELKAKAEKGFAEARYQLGKSYSEGKDVAKNTKLAASWYLKAAEQGLAKAQHKMGKLCEGGGGVPRDDKQAVVWYRKAYKQGYCEAGLALGDFYASPTIQDSKPAGPPRDITSALTWYRKALEGGCLTDKASSSNMLSHQMHGGMAGLYELSPTQHNQLAYMWIKVLEARGKTGILKVLKSEDFVEEMKTSLSPEQIMAAETWAGTLSKIPEKN